MALIFKNMNELFEFKSRFQEFVLTEIENYAFEYDEPSSLNLRRREGRIVMIFARELRKNNPPYPFDKPKKNSLAIQTVLKFDENLPYLREWIGYHMYLGFDKFFLYDNNGTVGHPGNRSNATHNKYGFGF